MADMALTLPEKVGVGVIIGGIMLFGVTALLSVALPTIWRSIRRHARLTDG